MGRCVDRTKKPFAMIAHALIDTSLRQMGSTAFMVYAVLKRDSDFDTDEADPTCARVATKTGLNRRTVWRAIRRLADLGHVTIIPRPGKSSIFYLQDCPDCSPEQTSDGPKNGSLPATPETHPPATPVSQDLRHPCRTTCDTDVAPRQTHQSDEPDKATPTTRWAAAAGDPLGSPNQQGVEKLVQYGVKRRNAQRIADMHDLSLIDLVLAYCRAGANGTKPVGPGLVVDIFKDLTGEGFRLVDDQWLSPPIVNHLGRGDKGFIPSKTTDQRTAATVALREQAAKDRAASAGPVNIRPTPQKG